MEGQDSPTTSAPAPPLLRRVRLQNYRSIASCDVPLGRLSVLVGPNGAGKSNFLDALRLVRDALSVSLDFALRDRGGIGEVRRRSGGHPTHFGIRLSFTLPDGIAGHYAFRIGSERDSGFTVQKEECVVAGGPAGAVAYTVERGNLSTRLDVRLPPPSPDRLYLPSASALPEFRAAFDALTSMAFNSLGPDAMRDVQSPDPGMQLTRDGSNIASVLQRLQTAAPLTKTRIDEFLSKVVPGVRSAQRRSIGPKETIEFQQDVAGAARPWKFLASSMSDGTVRALGVLVALFQVTTTGNPAATLVGIEEPELALHPAAAGVLLDALVEASERVQVVITSHSPDLLDSEKVPTESLLAVSADDDITMIGRIDQAGRKVLRSHLFTAGELLRQDQLRADPAEARPTQQLDLFGSEA